MSIRGNPQELPRENLPRLVVLISMAILSPLEQYCNDGTPPPLSFQSSLTSPKHLLVFMCSYVHSSTINAMLMVRRRLGYAQRDHRQADFVNY